MLSNFEKSNVYATYNFGRYHAKLWEEITLDCYLRASVYVGYVVEDTTTGKTVQINTTGHYAPEWNEDLTMKKYRLEMAYEINDRYFPNAERLTVTVLGLAQRDWHQQTGQAW